MKNGESRRQSDVLRAPVVALDFGFPLLNDSTRRLRFNVFNLGIRDPDFGGFKDFKESGSLWVIQDTGGIASKRTEGINGHVDSVRQCVRENGTIDLMSLSSEGALGQVFENEHAEIFSPSPVFYVRVALTMSLFKTGGIIIHRDKVPSRGGTTRFERSGRHAESSKLGR
jgi:hypothetical protein